MLELVVWLLTLTSNSCRSSNVLFTGKAAASWKCLSSSRLSRRDTGAQMDSAPEMQRFKEVGGTILCPSA